MTAVTYISDTQIENLSKDILVSLGINKAPIDVEYIAKRKGLDIKFIKLDDDVSGALILDEKKPTICVNKDESIERRRFTIAHEIGHFVLHKNREELFIDKNLYVALRSNNFASKNEKIMEIQANKFAAALLMPKDYLLKEIGSSEVDLDNETELDLLAEKFKVSTQAMTIRLANIEIKEFDT